VIILTGMPSSSESKTRHEFSLTFDDRVAQLLSPSARIVVFCVTPTGEIISDSFEFSVDAAFANEVSDFTLVAVIYRFFCLVLYLIF